MKKSFPILLFLLCFATMGLFAQSEVTSPMPGSELPAGVTTFSASPNCASTQPVQEWLVSDPTILDNDGNPVIVGSSTSPSIDLSALGFTSGEALEVNAVCYDLARAQTLVDDLYNNTYLFTPCCTIVQTFGGIDACGPLMAAGIQSGSDIQNLDDIITLLNALGSGGGDLSVDSFQIKVDDANLVIVNDLPSACGGGSPINYTISATANYTIECVDAPEIPDNLVAVPYSGNCVRIGWTVEPDATRYRFRFRPIGGSWMEGLTQSDENFKYLNGLTPNTTYEYQEKTQFADFNSVWSCTRTFTTTADICDKPEGLTHMDMGGGSVTFSWGADADDVKYRFRHKIIGTSGWIENSNVLTNSYTLNLTPGATYKYYLKTRCSGGWTQWTSKGTVTPVGSFTDGSAGTSNLFVQDGDVKLFPNPATNMLNFATDVEFTDYQISNIAGQRMATAPINDTTIDVSNLQTGVYFITFIQEGNVVTKRFVKQ